MPESAPVLGICYSGNRLLYAISAPDQTGELLQVGCIDYTFDVHDAIIDPDSEMFAGIYNAIGRLNNDFAFHEVRLLTLPQQECWTTIPNTVYGEHEDRNAHLNILTTGNKAAVANPIWYSLSNRDYKLVNLRNRNYLECLDKLTENVSNAQYYSEFETGGRWIEHSKSKGSFLTVSCQKNVISISSFILGKLRAATYIKYEDLNDLPYFWLQHSGNLNWLNGFYDQILLYGFDSYKILEVLQPFWEDQSEIIEMNSLEKMQVNAPEKTYSFNLGEAFPAIMLVAGNRE